MYFLGAIAVLKSQSQDFQFEVEDLLIKFSLFQSGLVSSNKTLELVKIQLDQFVSSMETCEGTVSRTKVTQTATKGTIMVIDKALDDIRATLDETKEQLSEAEKLASGWLIFLYKKNIQCTVVPSIRIKSKIGLKAKQFRNFLIQGIPSNRKSV